MFRFEMSVRIQGARKFLTMWSLCFNLHSKNSTYYYYYYYYY